MPRKIQAAEDMTFPAPPPNLTELQASLTKATKAQESIRAVIATAKKEMETKVAEETKQLAGLDSQIEALRAGLQAARDRLLLNLLSQEGVLDMFAPDHGRTSCSDENVCNEERCVRCTLIKATERQYLDFTWSFHIDGV